MDRAAHALDSNLPARLDRLPWSRFHWLVVVALGITWVLDGLEVTIVSAVAGVLEDKAALGLSSTQVGAAATSYLLGAIGGALLFGHLTDRYGRKRLFLVTLLLYIVATLLTALSFNFVSFALFRMLTGAAIGGEYAAINAAIDELLPARVRGLVDIAINGSYWLGTAMGAVMSTVLLDPLLFPKWLGFRLSFALGAVLTVAVALVRKWVPESPRWLLLQGQRHAAEQVVCSIEQRVIAHTGKALPAVAHTLLIPSCQESLGYMAALRLIFGRYRKRGVLGVSLMTAQAFFYNAIFFTYALMLTRFFAVRPEDVGSFLIPFAIANFLGPLLLGRLFDTVGRRPLIVTTYGLSGALLIAVGALFRAGLLDASTQTLCWTVVFFFGSAAASSAYLTVSELFPLSLRARAIALFYVIGTSVGGLGAPTLFGWLIARGSRHELFLGYLLGGVLMLGAALIASKLAVAAEGKSLEQIAALD
jgi:MFS family permease